MNFKFLNRIKLVSSNALRQAFTSLYNILIPLLVIHLSSKIIWGQFVSFLLYILFSQQLINWGNKEYLIRRYSENPSKIKELSASTLITRIPILIIFIIVDFTYFKPIEGVFLFFWHLGLFFSNATESLVIYNKKFLSALFIETFCFLFFFISIFFTNNAEVTQIIKLYSFYQFIKGIFYFLLCNNEFSKKGLKFNLTYFQETVWFFFLSILGFLCSRIDVYIIERFNNKTATSNYQIMNTLLVFIMSLPVFLYIPYIKNIYRNNVSIIHNAKKKLAIIGLILVPISLIFISVLQKKYLINNYSLKTYTIAFFYVFPSFIYGIDILYLFKNHKEKTVVFVLMTGAFINFILTFLFVKNNFKLESALLGSAIAQISTLLLFQLTIKMENEKN